MKCLKPSRIVKNLDKRKFPDGLLVPCGRCMNCRLQKREEWVMRIIHEYNYWEGAMFITLTYNDESLPPNSSLIKGDLQKFFKRLRKNIHPRKIKYFACGEYGEQSGRPHYHCIIYGLDYLSDDDWVSIKVSWPYCDWPSLGNSPFGTVTPQSIRYTVSYIEKSIKGDWEKYAYDNIEKPFHILSNGLGKQHFLDNADTIKSNGYINMRGHSRSLPRYYINLGNIDTTEMHAHAKQTECELVESIIGINVDRDTAYRTLDVTTVLKLEETIKSGNAQHDRNLIAKKDLSLRRKKRDT